MRELIGEIPKNALERIEVSKAEYQGRPYLDVRVYFLAADQTWKPTKKGVTVSLDGVGELADIIQRAADVIKQGAN